MSQKELTLDFFKKQGAKGGKLGGALAWEQLPFESLEAWEKRKSERARNAVANRPDVKAKREREEAARKKEARKRTRRKIG